VAPRTCFLVLSFGSIAPQISELRGVKNRPFPFTRHIAYTTACCYRTSRDTNNRRIRESLVKRSKYYVMKMYPQHFQYPERQSNVNNIFMIGLIIEHNQHRRRWELVLTANLLRTMTIATALSELPSLHRYGPLIPPTPPANAMISQSVRRSDEVTIKAGFLAEWHWCCAMISWSYCHVIVLRPCGVVVLVEQFRMAFSPCCTRTFCGRFVINANDSEITSRKQHQNELPVCVSVLPFLVLFLFNFYLYCTHLSMNSTVYLVSYSRL